MDPYWPFGAIAINGDKPTTFKRRVLLLLLSSDVGRTSESVDTYFEFYDDASVPSGVTQMRMWNPGKQTGAVWVLRRDHPGGSRTIAPEGCPSGRRGTPGERVGG